MSPLGSTATRDARKGEPPSYLRAPPRSGAAATEAVAASAALLLTSAHAPYFNTLSNWELPQCPALPDPSRFYRASPIAVHLVSAKPITEMYSLTSSVTEEKLESRHLFETWLGGQRIPEGLWRPPPPGGRSGSSRWLPGSSEQRRLAAERQNGIIFSAESSGFSNPPKSPSEESWH